MSHDSPRETPTTPTTSEQSNITPESTALQPGDFYTEGPYLVFTEQYHLRRGYCCNSNCRHCPYK